MYLVYRGQVFYKYEVQNHPALLLPGLGGPVFAGCDSHQLFKYFGKIIVVFIAYHQSNFRDGFVAGDQQLLGGLDTVVGNEPGERMAVGQGFGQIAQLGGAEV